MKLGYPSVWDVGTQVPGYPFLTLNLFKLWIFLLKKWSWVLLYLKMTQFFNNFDSELDYTSLKKNHIWTISLNFWVFGGKCGKNRQIWSIINYPHYPGIYLWVPGTKMRQEDPGIWVEVRKCIVNMIWCESQIRFSKIAHDMIFKILQWCH